MQPFFRHYGAKWRLSAKLRPPRRYPIIEPFAGSAGFSVRYGEGKPVFLYDTCADTVEIWEYLIAAGEEDILRLPVEPVHEGENVFALDIPYPAALLIQRWLTPQGSPSHYRLPPTNRAAARAGRLLGSYWSRRVRGRIANQLEGIRDWTAVCASYNDVKVRDAHWHIDPPYRDNAGAAGHYTGEGLDYHELAEWCKRLPGDVTVHEQAGANWLPFVTLDEEARSGRIVGGRIKRQREVFWSKYERGARYGAS